MSNTLYRMYGDGANPIYIGITGDPGRRIKEHSKDKRWWSQVKTIQLEHYPTRRDLETAELEAIELEKPAYNKVGKSGVKRKGFRWLGVVEYQTSAGSRFEAFFRVEKFAAYQWKSGELRDENGNEFDYRWKSRAFPTLAGAIRWRRGQLRDLGLSENPQPPLGLWFGIHPDKLSGKTFVARVVSVRPEDKLYTIRLHCDEAGRVEQPVCVFEHLITAGRLFVSRDCYQRSIENGDWVNN